MDNEGQARLAEATAEAYPHSHHVDGRDVRCTDLTHCPSLCRCPVNRCTAHLIPAVAQAHIIADLDAERARLLGQVTAAREMLRDVRHMIANGALDVADEHVDRALTILAPKN